MMGIGDPCFNRCDLMTGAICDLDILEGVVLVYMYIEVMCGAFNHSIGYALYI